MFYICSFGFIIYDIQYEVIDLSTLRLTYMSGEYICDNYREFINCDGTFALLRLWYERQFNRFRVVRGSKILLDNIDITPHWRKNCIMLVGSRVLFRFVDLYVHNQDVGISSAMRLCDDILAVVFDYEYGSVTFYFYIGNRKESSVVAVDFEGKVIASYLERVYVNDDKNAASALSKAVMLGIIKKYTCCFI